MFKVREIINKMRYFVLFGLIFQSVTCVDVPSPPIQKIQWNDKDIAKNFVNLYEKFQYLDEEMALLNQRVSKLEANPSTVNNTDVSQIKGNIRQIMSVIEYLAKEKEGKSREIERLNQLVEKIDQKVNANKNAISEVSSKCKCVDEIPIRSKVCDANPCLNGGSCVLTSTGNDFQCSHCPYPTGGKLCEQLNCGANKCFQRDGIVYVLYETLGTWEQANQKCVGVGMSLATPKDQGTNDFLISQLRPIQGLVNRAFFWIGLKKQANGQWQWTNGSPLGDYTGSKANFKSVPGQSCALLYFIGGNELWTPIPCEHTHYPLCEKRVFLG